MLPGYDAPMTSRDAAAAILEEGHRALAELFGRLDDEAFSRPNAIGSGREWSAKDLAGHLGIWETFATWTIEEVGRGERPAIEDWFNEPDAGDRVNAEGIERFQDASAADVRERFEALHAQVVAAIFATEDEGWAATYPNDEDPTLGDRVGSLLGAEDGRFRHAFAHLDDLRAYVEPT
jgi:Mycothiol maleylpyruvate isomerase N-terminal domain